jgi:hypothetical protein
VWPLPARQFTLKKIGNIDGLYVNKSQPREVRVNISAILTQSEEKVADMLVLYTPHRRVKCARIALCEKPYRHLM